MAKKKKKKGFFGKLGAKLGTPEGQEAFSDIIGGLAMAFDPENAGKSMKPTPKNQPVTKPKFTLGGLGAQLSGLGKMYNTNYGSYNKSR